MALISCPKCGAQISILAPQCPHCGWQQDIAAPQPQTLHEEPTPQPQPQPQPQTMLQMPLSASSTNIFGKLSIAGAAISITLIIPFIFYFGQVVKNGNLIEGWEVIALCAAPVGMFIATCRREHLAAIVMTILSLFFFFNFTGDLDTEQLERLKYDVDDEPYSLYSLMKNGSLVGMIIAGVCSVVALITGNKQNAMPMNSLTKVDVLMCVLFVVMILMPTMHGNWYEISGEYLDDTESMRGGYITILLNIAGTIGVAAVVGQRYSVALAMAVVALIMQVVNMFYIFDIELNPENKEWIRESHLNIEMSGIAIGTLVGTIVLSVIAFARNREYSVERTSAHSNEMVLPAILFVIAFFVSTIPSAWMGDAGDLASLKSSGAPIEGNYTLLGINPYLGTAYMCMMYATITLLMCRNYISAGIVASLASIAAFVLLSKADYITNSFVGILPGIIFGIIALLAFIRVARGKDRVYNFDCAIVACAGAVIVAITGADKLLPLIMVMTCVTGRYKIASVAMSVIAFMLLDNKLIYDPTVLTEFNSIFATIAAFAKWAFIIIPLYTPARWVIAKLMK